MLNCAVINHRGLIDQLPSLNTQWDEASDLSSSPPLHPSCCDPSFCSPSAVSRHIFALLLHLSRFSRNSSAHLEMNLSLSVCNLMKPKATFISLHLSHLGLGLALSLYFRRSPYPQTLLSVLLSHSASDEDNLWEGAKRCACVKRKEDTGRGEWRPSQLADLWLRDQRGVWTKDKNIENSGVMHFFSFSFFKWAPEEVLTHSVP